MGSLLGEFAGSTFGAAITTSEVFSSSLNHMYKPVIAPLDALDTTSSFYTTDVVLPTFTAYPDNTCTSPIGDPYFGVTDGLTVTVLPGQCIQFFDGENVASAFVSCSGKNAGEIPDITMFADHQSNCSGNSRVLSEGEFCYRMLYGEQFTSPTCQMVSPEDMILSLVITGSKFECEYQWNALGLSMIWKNYVPDTCMVYDTGYSCTGGVGLAADFVTPGQCSFQEDEVSRLYPKDCEKDENNLYHSLVCFFGGGSLDPVNAGTITPTTSPLPNPTLSPTTPPTPSPSFVNGTIPTNIPESAPTVSPNAIPVSTERVAYDHLVNIFAGGARTCALNRDGFFKCWGMNALGQEGNSAIGLQQVDMGEQLYLLPRTNVTQVVDIACSALATCIALDTGRVRCFGSGLFGLTGNSDVADNQGMDYPFIDFGTDSEGNHLHVESVSAGAFHMCVVFKDKRVKCWGNNSQGELGIGDTNNRGDHEGELGDNLPFVDLGGDESGAYKAKHIALGQIHSCALLENGRLKCWGNSYFLSEGGLNAATFPLLNIGRDHLGSPLRVKQVEVSETHNCVLFENQRIKCWGIFLATGYEDKHYLLDDDLPFVDVGTDGLGWPLPVVSVAVGYSNTCVIVEGGRVKCWGQNREGEAGLGDAEPHGSTAGSMGNSLPFVDLGTDEFGLPLKAIRLAMGPNHSCALFENHRMKCWGRNEEGALGIGDQLPRGTSIGEMGDNLPFVDFDSSLKVHQVSAGIEHTCVILSDKQIKCFGENSFAQGTFLGNVVEGSIGDEPQEMGFRLPYIDFGFWQDNTKLAVKQVASGFGFTCVLIIQNERVKCFGKSNLLFTQLPRPLSWDDSSYVNFGYDHDGHHLRIKQLSASLSHFCVLFTNSRIKCFGQNVFGILGPDAEGLMAENVVEMDFLDLGEDREGQVALVKHVEALSWVTCAILMDESMKCFGANQSGQLGQGNKTPRGTSKGFGLALPPIDFGTDENGNPLRVQGVSGGQGHNVASGFICALFTTGRIKCLGDNTFGQLGLGTDARDVGSSPVHLGNNLRYVELGHDALGRPLRAHQVVSSSSHSCALLHGGRVKCWGNNVFGQLALGTEGNYVGLEAGDMGDALPFANLGHYLDGQPRLVRRLSASFTRTCAITLSDRLLCWGTQSHGELGNGKTANIGGEGASGALIPYVKLGTPCGAGLLPSEVSVCQACPAGTFEEGYEAVCSPCAPGTYAANVGQATCTRCPTGLFGGRGSIVCSACPAGRTTLLPGSALDSSCVAVPGLVEDLRGNVVPCPSFGNCTAPGLTLQTLPLLPGKWRSRLNATAALDCPVPAACVGGHGELPTSVHRSTVYCREGHVGPQCQGCLPGFGLARGLCEPCSQEEQQNDRNNTFALWGSATCVFVLATCATAVGVHSPGVRSCISSTKDGLTSCGRKLLDVLLGFWEAVKQFFVDVGDVVQYKFGDHFVAMKAKGSGCVDGVRRGLVGGGRGTKQLLERVKVGLGCGAAEAGEARVGCTNPMGRWRSQGENEDNLWMNIRHKSAGLRKQLNDSFKSLRALLTPKRVAPKDLFTQLKAHVKLNFGYFQIMESFLFTFGRASVGGRQLSDVLFFDPNVFSYLGSTGSCFTMSFNASLVFFSLGPIITAMTVACVFHAANLCARPRKRHPGPTANAVDPYAEYKRYSSQLTKYGIGFLVLQTSLVVPGTLRRLLSTFPCDTFDDLESTRLLRADISMLCEDRFYEFAATMVVLYGGSALALQVITLVKAKWHRKRHAPPQVNGQGRRDPEQQPDLPGTGFTEPENESVASANAIPEGDAPNNTEAGNDEAVALSNIWEWGEKVLIGAYKEQYREFELFEFIRKVIQAPMIVLYADGSQTQILVSMGLCIAVIVLYALIRPFANNRLLLVALFNQCQLLVFCFISLQASSTGELVSTALVSAVVWSGGVLSLICLFSMIFVPQSDSVPLSSENAADREHADGREHAADDAEEEVLGEIILDRLSSYDTAASNFHSINSDDEGSFSGHSGNSYTEDQQTSVQVAPTESSNPASSLRDGVAECDTQDTKGVVPNDIAREQTHVTIDSASSSEQARVQHEESTLDQQLSQV